jgi:hypothetical protein
VDDESLFAAHRMSVESAVREVAACGLVDDCHHPYRLVDDDGTEAGSEPVIGVFRGTEVVGERLDREAAAGLDLRSSSHVVPASWPNPDAWHPSAVSLLDGAAAPTVAATPS